MPDSEPGSKVLVRLFWILVVSKSKDFLLYAYIAEIGLFLFLLNGNFQEKKRAAQSERAGQHAVWQRR
ncbi:hypothetical protein [Allofranklinella schreckenbergeri]|uniref:hypothetical protein n=1 Tax=Allofranklinella schreckenbergeri TaxID=1076744 RepID=UPI0011C3DD06|nr:hypothetical protein [Allofranklinella schreckenbergeri]